MSTAEAMLHVTNGDMAAQALQAAGVAGDIAVLFDVLHEGPAPAVGRDRWREIRARFAADCGWTTVERAQTRQRAVDAALDAAPGHEEVVLWFEDDLCCQLALIRLLWDLGDRGVDLGRMTVASGAAVGVASLPALSAGDIAGMFRRRQRLSETAMAAGVRAWVAFAAPDPSELQVLLTRGDGLGALGAALHRHLEEFPSVGRGLGRTEQQALEVAAEGATDLPALFRSVASSEERPFMTDLVFRTRVNRMASAPAALLRVAGAETSAPAGLGGSVTVTGAGRAVLAGQADWRALDESPRWLGGVQLARGRPCWRWDRASRSLSRET